MQDWGPHLIRTAAFRQETSTGTIFWCSLHYIYRYFQTICSSLKSSCTSVVGKSRPKRICANLFFYITQSNDHGCETALVYTKGRLSNAQCIIHGLKHRQVLSYKCICWLINIWQITINLQATSVLTSELWYTFSRLEVCLVPTWLAFQYQTKLVLFSQILN